MAGRERGTPGRGMTELEVAALGDEVGDLIPVLHTGLVLTVTLLNSFAVPGFFC